MPGEKKMNHRSNEYISKALKLASELMCLAGEGDRLEECGDSGIFFGVLRDCAYKIRRHAQHEGHKAQSNFLRSKAMLVIFAAALSILFASPLNATTIIMSTSATETSGGLTFGRGDLAEYDSATDTATLYFDGSSLFGNPSTDIDAAHILENGNIILSTLNGATLGGLSFGKGDLIEYNPITDTATLCFDEDLFAQNNENIDAVYFFESGNIILSTTGNATLGGLSFSSDDLIEYNPTTDTATMFLDGSVFGWSTNIEAVHLLENGNIILSTGTYVSLGGLDLGTGDLVEYNPTTDTSTLYFDESHFDNGANIDSVYVTSLPEPTTIAMLGLGSLVFINRKSR
jgi:hypothetical protein